MKTAAEFYGAGYKYQDGIGQGGSGMTTGASRNAGSRSATHAYVTGTGKVACGRALKGYTYRINRDLPGAAPDRALTCKACRKALGL